jgi:hypothetical protein
MLCHYYPFLSLHIVILYIILKIERKHSGKVSPYLQIIFGYQPLHYVQYTNIDEALSYGFLRGPTVSGSVICRSFKTSDTPEVSHAACPAKPLSS